MGSLKQVVWVFAALGCVVGSAASADCNGMGKAYPAGATACQGGFEFVCNADSSWRKTRQQCTVPQKPASATDAAKEPPQPKEPPSTPASQTTGL